MPPVVTVVMPLFNQATFVGRSLASLFAQAFTDWQLLIVDDGSTDDWREAAEKFLRDPRLEVVELGRNHGLGVALNRGLERADSPYVAYLPADDLYHPGHLASLVEHLEARPEAVAVYSGVRHHYNKFAPGVIEESWLQPVQVLHRVGHERWLEREELVTDDLERMFWGKLRSRGEFVGTGEVSCEWVDHPHQRHKTIQEPLGGVNPYRVRYGVNTPLRFHTSRGYRLDEVEHFRRFRERPDTPMAPDGLKILLVGELAYNPERVLALEELGHKLYGLWMDEPQWFNYVGPMPFGHIEDLPREGWEEAVRRIRPDVIYALLNWQAVPFAHRVLTANPGVPFVWHFKEGPFICLEKGSWGQLVELFTRSDGQVYSSPEMRDWFMTVLPGGVDPETSYVLDGDLPKRDWFTGVRSRRLSEDDGQIHTVVPGRPIGLHPPTVGELAAHGIHLHFYGDFNHGLWRGWIAKALALAPDHLHLHPHVEQENWVSEFSRYDAGWLHYFKSENSGELVRANWDDLNYPARIATLAVAGLPLLQRDNSGAIVASQTLVRERNLGLFFTEVAELAGQFQDRAHLATVQQSVWNQREDFMFDHHADELVAFLRRIVELGHG